IARLRGASSDGGERAGARAEALAQLGLNPAKSVAVGGAEARSFERQARGADDERGHQAGARQAPDHDHVMLSLSSVRSPCCELRPGRSFAARAAAAAEESIQL